ncbi:MAG: glycosyltransferase family 39 protein [Acidobacteria bacterium]|nr:glycosyltransferase family 39 protein [Acidobacteriota bacterium]
MPILLTVIVIAINLPFINQAFHIDDPIYVLLAKQVLKNPRFPQDVPVFFEGTYARDLASMEHPPLTAYLLAVSAIINREFSEIALHLGFMVFPVILAVSMYFLSRRFTRHPVTSALLLMSLPVVYIMSHNLMTDLPLLALWTLSVVVFVSGVDGKRRSLLWAGGCLAVLASLVSYAGLCLIPLLMLYAWLRRDWHAIATVFVGSGAAVLFWHAVNYAHYRRMVFGYMLGYYFGTAHALSPLLVFEKLTYLVVVLGGVTLFPFVTLVFYTALERRRIYAGIGAALIVSAFIRVPTVSSGHRCLFVFFCASGLALLCGVLKPHLSSLPRVLRDVRGHADQVFLVAWLLGMLLFCIVCFMTGCARYILPMTPPLVLLSVRELECRLDAERFRRWVLLAVMSGFSLALALAVADYRFAGIYRRFAADFSSSFGPLRSRIWFTGEWGLRAYMEKLGGNELGRQDSRPRVGDLLVVPSLATPYQTLFDDVVGIESIVMLAPSQLSFDVPALTKDSSLILMIGMPLWKQSDGVDLQVRFVSTDKEGMLYSRTLSSEEGRTWRSEEIPLGALAGQRGALEFSAGSGQSGNADGDWIAIARARIRRRGSDNAAYHDFRTHLADAHITTAAGAAYHTPGNLPVFASRIWLNQEPAKTWLKTYRYAPTLTIRLLNAEAHAGFWSMGWGFLPFSFSSGHAPLEQISVYEITREVDAYGERRASWYPDE